jgi:hypothetical protein
MNLMTTAFVGLAAMIALRGLPLVALWLRLQFTIRREREHGRLVLAVLRSSPSGVLVGEWRKSDDSLRVLISYERGPSGGGHG